VSDQQLVPVERFTFVDLFAGIGGFHAALGALGGRCVYASEIDRSAAAVYSANWDMPVAGDIVEATQGRMDVPPHDVLVAGFPCQPFSKSGFQRGMEEARGTLFYNILEVLRHHRPAVVLLENVRNLAGPRHAHEWDVIVTSLRQLGYRVSSTPAVFSPHLLPPEMGGRPQVRERVFIAATYVGTSQSHQDVPPVVTNKPVGGWDKHRWVLREHLPLEGLETDPRYGLTDTETRWVEAWDDFIRRLRADGRANIPGHPIWADEFRTVDDLRIEKGTPRWKADFLRKNAELYTNHRKAINAWLVRWKGLEDFPASRRKLEWQAQDAESLFDTVMHFRPSGIRAKKPTYLPALVAITQTSILGSERRRISPKEAARLQGLPEWFDFGDQREALTYKQLGNGVNVGVVMHVLREQVRRDRQVLEQLCPRLVRCALDPAAKAPAPPLVEKAGGLVQLELDEAIPA